ncbi:hypothetical protein EJ08DRAFT_43069 [Tothia fuscella]|uniref:Uncharacterized protein n=1 Tax=Tothia fuscella TaxID=1048955 RepID=A0A9P4TSV6_9PEZI|nr:hypothetical protein EJ08DRAFT_43069 [Tothia fuscella]
MHFLEYMANTNPQPQNGLPNPEHGKENHGRREKLQHRPISPPYKKTKREQEGMTPDEAAQSSLGSGNDHEERPTEREPPRSPLGGDEPNPTSNFNSEGGPESRGEDEQIDPEILRPTVASPYFPINYNYHRHTTTGPAQQRRRLPRSHALQAQAQPSPKRKRSYHAYLPTTPTRLRQSWSNTDGEGLDDTSAVLRNLRVINRAHKNVTGWEKEERQVFESMGIKSARPRDTAQKLGNFGKWHDCRPLGLNKGEEDGEMVDEGVESGIGLEEEEEL